MRGSTILRGNTIICLLALALCAPLLTSCGLSAINATTAAQTAPDTTLRCQPQDCLAQALTFKRNNQPERAYAVLAAIRANYPETEWSARASYLLGLAALEDGSANLAVQLFREAARLTAIEDRVLFNLAQAYAADGQHALAATLFGAITAMHQDSVLTKSAKYRHGKALFDAGDYEPARLAFDDFCTTYSGDALTKDALIASAHASIKLSQPQSAISPLRRLNILYPAYRSSAQSAAEVDALIATLNATGLFMPGLTQDERLTRADALFVAQHWEDAAAAYKEIDSPQLLSTAALRSAEAMQRLKRYATAEDILDNYLKSAPEASVKPRALRLLVTSLIRQDKAEDLTRLVQGRMLRNLPSSTELAEAQLAAGRYFDDKGDNKAAMSLYARLLDAYADTSAAREAAWSIGWKNYREGRYKEAARVFSSGCGQGSARCLYWSGRASEKAGLVDVATGYYQKACSFSETSYYCLLASRRSPSAVNSIPVEPLQGLFPVAEDDRQGRLALYKDVHYLAAAELNLLGITKQAAAELDLITVRYSRDRRAALALSSLFYEIGDIYRGLRTWRLYLSDAPGQQPYGPSMSYPVQAIELARECSDAQLTDPYLIASIMREESAFNPEAMSRAGAMGMMQLMPSTARFIAKKTAAPDFKTSELLISHTNIRLGSRYLDYLLGIFDGNIIQAVAAYNAGPGAVRTWTQKYSNEPDEFIESIPYPETREYTKRVISTYDRYLRLSEAAPEGAPALVSFDSRPATLLLNYGAQENILRRVQ